MNIVIVEDDQTIRENLHEILEANNYRVKSYADGLDGLDGIRANLPDLVLCDVMLPKIDGYEILSQLREDPKTANIPFIFLTALADRADQRKGMELGADDFIVKPFTTQELIKAIGVRIEKEKHTETKIQSAVKDKLHDFTKITSHEYNTPLNGIIGLTETLVDNIDELSKEEILEIARGIQRSSKRLYRTFKNFMMFFQIERGELRSVKSTLDTQWIRFYAESTLKQKAQKFKRSQDAVFNFQMNGEFSSKLPAEDLAYMMEELTWNAFKFSEAGKVVKVNLYTDHDGFEFQISNHTDEEAFFDAAAPFKQIDREQYEQQGSGLGLYVCKKLAEIHGWELSGAKKADVVTISLRVKA